MTKQTLFISQPAHLFLERAQLCIHLKTEESVTKQRPIEDLAILILEHQQITLTQQLLAYLGGQNVVVVFCDASHLPNSMLLSFDAHYIQSARFNQQIATSLPLKKQLWKKTIQCKIRQQAKCLDGLQLPGSDMLYSLVQQVKSGDTTNQEAQAARCYWQCLMGVDFYRSRIGPHPNPWLNYGYAILRAATARALAGHGLLNSLGIHHHNRYNAFCLADDIMEPYRPFVDAIVYHMYQEELPDTMLDRPQKIRLLQLLTMDCRWQSQQTTVGLSLQRTAACLAECFEQRISQPLCFATL